MKIGHCLANYLHQAIKQLNLITKKVYHALENVYYAMKNTVKTWVPHNQNSDEVHGSHNKEYETHNKKSTSDGENIYNTSFKSICFLITYHQYPNSLCHAKTMTAHSPMLQKCKWIRIKTSFDLNLFKLTQELVLCHKNQRINHLLLFFDKISAVGQLLKNI